MVPQEMLVHRSCLWKRQDRAENNEIPRVSASEISDVCSGQVGCGISLRIIIMRPFTGINPIYEQTWCSQKQIHKLET